MTHRRCTSHSALASVSSASAGIAAQGAKGRARPWTNRAARLLLGSAVLLAALGSTAALARDDAYDRLADRFDRLANDPVLGQRAIGQMDRARASLAALKEAGRGDRDELAYLTERRIEIARASAETEYLEGQRGELQRENDRMQLVMARRDAAQARAELEHQRLQSQIRAEETERQQREAEAARLQGEQATEAALAQADQAKRMADAQAKATALARREAELSAALAGNAAAAPKGKPAATAASSMVLSESIFAPGKATLASGSAKQFGKAAAFANADPSRRVRIEVSAGSDKVLADQRAKSVREALIAAGVDASRLTTAGTAGKGKRIELMLQAGKR